MWRRVKNSFDSGIGKIKWFSSILSDRLRIEFSVIKLMQDREKKEKERAEKMRLIGEKVYELRDQPDRKILGDKELAEAIGDIEKLDAEIEELKRKASEMSRIEE